MSVLQLANRASVSIKSVLENARRNLSACGRRIVRVYSGKRGTALFVLHALILVGLCYRATYIIEFNPIDNIWSDTERHWDHGISVLRDDPYIMGEPVMYQLYIGALAKLALDIPELVAFYTILLSLLTTWIWYRFFRELQPSKLIAVGGWAVVTWAPSLSGIFGYFMSETLMLPMLGLALWATWRSKRKQTLSTFLWMVLLWALAGLTRGICIPMAAVASTWLWFTQSQKFSKAMLGILLLAFILLPLGYRTWDKVRVFAPHGMGDLNVIYSMSGKDEIKLTYRRWGAVWYYGFMSPSIRSQPFEPFSDWTGRRQGQVFVDIDAEQGSRDWKAAKRANAMTWDKYVWITKENLIFLFFGESWPDSNRERVLGELTYQGRWLWAPLGLICLVWLGFCWHSQRHYLLLPSIIFAWFVVQGLLPIAVSEGRYRKPFEILSIAQLVLLAGTARRRPVAEPELTPTVTQTMAYQLTFYPLEQNTPVVERSDSDV